MLAGMHPAGVELRPNAEGRLRCDAMGDADAICGGLDKGMVGCDADKCSRVREVAMGAVVSEWSW